ncbi:uncharacterized protein MYCFIDRAFT_210490 [Pseudocercospora fijiensis CIRAD86]|uniref:Uncharacterized protein n=1 Tax=Pseudocercospora fijiensis (strain CIRAD86) TaxID=383855 RepID=M3AP58_PSEFD|nr:uncharacterized protein MYCFIDRAFT_210490 [Pseudocercospora fijiensis CIRAD86]EME86381.1 hypothetical protein MYCFIDRAFT_210490 [Pseudocercospora fijiensis CIRAD86]
MKQKLMQQEGTHVDLKIGEKNKTAARRSTIHRSLPLGDKTGSALPGRRWQLVLADGIRLPSSSRRQLTWFCDVRMC